MTPRPLRSTNRHPLHRILAGTLLTAGLTAQLPLPPVPVPAQNPLTPAKIVLGKALFWDEQLSADDSTACATCHMPEVGGSDPRFAVARHPGPDGLYGTDDDIRGSVGVVRQDAAGDFKADPTFATRRQVTRRMAATTHGAAYHAELFWDGRASTVFVDPETSQVLIPFDGALESQAVGPILSDVEMAGEGRTWNDVRQKLQRVQPLALASNLTPDLVSALQQHPTYPDLFQAAFGDPAINAARIAFALASYQRTLIPDQTPWDDYMNGNQQALTPQQERGWLLFQGGGRCAACHPAPLFTDDTYHNLGIRPAAEDAGRAEVTQLAFEAGSFKTPILRNSGLRPRLFHGGTSAALGDPSELSDPNSALNIYFLGGGVDRSNLDPFLLVLANQGLNRRDVQDIMEFVRGGLTDRRAALGLPPFDHPTLRSTATPAPRVFGNSVASGLPPTLIDTIPSFVGNREFKLGVVGAPQTSLAYVAYSTTSLEPGAWYSGIPVNIAGNADGRVFVLNGTGVAPSLATWRLAIPANPSLRSSPVFFQPFALDAGLPTGIAAGQGWEIAVR